ncbi:ArnT family glycosyltransferase [Acidithiobacillus sulfuriphilus]|uniref:Glycosyltransferase family 39 protein n=2 Tax=Acidithiobacillus sulfuriphilus TaxID=1867749 RepID=A0A3M8QW18_9PROT|nr:glycosyltransferase family 39 protein [Acidithiobacillus sulfuriphilus]RNF60446.1 glycosyltransferase family 39 protein [Acidithiobacillus sulfuriphilus]
MSVENNPSSRSFLFKAFGLFLLVFLFFGWDVGNTSLWDIDEPTYAQSLKEMMAHHNLIVPTFNGKLLPDKPILNYWLMWTGVKLFGMNSWGLRIGSAAVGALLVFSLVLALRRLYGESSALIAGFCTATALHSTIIFRGATPDPLLILTVTIALLTYLRGYLLPKERTRDLLITYAAMALATLDKGPIGFLLPGLIIVLFLLARRDLPFLWREGRLAMGLPVFFLVVLPWYVAAGVGTHWAWDRAFLIQQNIGRFNKSMQGHRGPWFYYLISIFAGMLPWSIFLPQTIMALWARRRRLFMERPADTFMLIWAITWVAFFSLSATKLPSYVWEAYPPLFVLLAAHFQKVVSAQSIPSRRGAMISLGILFFLGLALTIFGGWIVTHLEPHLPAMAVVGLPFMLAAVIAMAFVWLGRWTGVLITLGTGAITLTALLVMVITPMINKVKPSQRMGERIAMAQGDQPYTLASWQWFQPNFLFYAGRGAMPIHHLQHLEELTQILGKGTVYLVCPATDVSRLSVQIPASYRLQTVMIRYEIYNHEKIALLRITPKT